MDIVGEGRFDCLGAVAGLSYDLQVRLALEHSLEPFANDGMVVCNEDVGWKRDGQAQPRLGRTGVARATHAHR